MNNKTYTDYNFENECECTDCIEYRKYGFQESTFGQMMYREMKFYIKNDGISKDILKLKKYIKNNISSDDILKLTAFIAVLLPMLMVLLKIITHLIL